MTDLLLRAPRDFARLDLVLEGGDLVLDPSLATASLASVFTDALAAPEDPLPDAGDDRRGWWAEALLVGELGEVWGSRLWLLSRSKLTNRTLADAEVYAREAFRWFLDRGIADRVEVSASRLDSSVLLLEVTLVRGEATSRAELWEETAQLSIGVGPARLELLAIP